MDDRNAPLELIAVEAVGIPMPRDGESAVPGQLAPDPTGLDDGLSGDLDGDLSGVDADVDADTSMDDDLGGARGPKAYRFLRVKPPAGYRAAWARVVPGVGLLSIQQHPGRNGAVHGLVRAQDGTVLHHITGAQAGRVAHQLWQKVRDEAQAVKARMNTLGDNMDNLDDALGANEPSDFGARGTLTIGTSGVNAPRNGVKVFSMRARTAKNARQAARAALRKFGRLRTVRAALASGVSLAVHAQIVAAGGGFNVRFYVTRKKAETLRKIKAEGGRGRAPTRRPARRPMRRPLPHEPGAQFQQPDGGGMDDGGAWTDDGSGLPALPSASPPPPSVNVFTSEQVNAATTADQPSAADALLAQILSDEEAAEDDGFMDQDGGELPPGMAGDELGAGPRIPGYHSGKWAASPEGRNTHYYSTGAWSFLVYPLSGGAENASELLVRHHGRDIAAYATTGYKGKAVEHGRRRFHHDLRTGAIVVTGMAGDELGAQTLTSQGWTAWPKRSWPNGHTGRGYTVRGSGNVTWAIMPAPGGWDLAATNRQGFRASMGIFKSPLAAVEARRAFMASGGHERLVNASQYANKADVFGDYLGDEMGDELGARRRRRRKGRPGQRRPLTAAERKKLMCARCRKLACNPEPVLDAMETNEEVEQVALGGPISPAQALALEYGHIRSVRPSRDARGRPIILVTFTVDESAPESVAGRGFGAAQERIIALPVFGGSVHPVLAELGGCPCKDWR